MIEEIFERLNRDDRDHAQRVRSYMDAHGWSLVQRAGQFRGLGSVKDIAD